jgi:hypothetical protein
LGSALKTTLERNAYADETAVGVWTPKTDGAVKEVARPGRREMTRVNFIVIISH